jgi:uncharacterized membrane protein YsdA (DUF1294 family)
VSGDIGDDETLRDYWNKRHPQRPESRKKEKFPSTLWYVIAIVFGIVGGLISYVATKEEYPDAAFSILIISFISTIVGTVLLFLLLFF